MSIIICYIQHSLYMRLNVSPYPSDVASFTSLLPPPCRIGREAARNCQRGRGGETQRERGEGVSQASTHAPAPYMHPIHSYLVPVTRWLQNGIDYWFPPYHRSVVLAGYSGLTESSCGTTRRRGRGGGGRHTSRKCAHTGITTHSQTNTDARFLSTTVVCGCVERMTGLTPCETKHS